MWTLGAVLVTNQEQWSLQKDYEKETKETVLSGHLDDDNDGRIIKPLQTMSLYVD